MRPQLAYPGAGEVKTASGTGGFLLDVTPISETYEFVLGLAICVLPSICEAEVVCDPFWYNEQVGVGNKDDYVVEMELHLEEDVMRGLFRGYLRRTTS